MLIFLTRLLSRFSEGLYILGNNFGGSIPSSIGGMTELRVLAADFNSFNGTLPTEIGLCTSLEELGLSSSDISSTIPTELGLLERLSEYCFTRVHFLEFATSSLTCLFQVRLVLVINCRVRSHLNWAIARVWPSWSWTPT